MAEVGRAPSVAMPRAAQLHRPGEEESTEWVDRFMKQILARDYDASRETLRSAVARGASQRLAQQYGKVLENFLSKRDELENPVVLARFGACILRQIDPETGRGLAVPGYVPGGSELWKQRPLMYIQSPSSRRSVQVCCACLAPVGSLASQLAHVGLPSPPGAEAVLLGSGICVPCGEEGCGEVFCSQECRDWALRESSHALLCAGRLPPARLEALRALERFAEDRDLEHMLLLGHGLARMVLALREGEPLVEVLRRYTQQFASKPWDALAEGGNGATDEDTPESRRASLAEAMALLRALFEGEELAAPFLEEELLSGLLGTFELVNMCVSLNHPLNERGEEIAGLLDAQTLAGLAETQRAAEDDSDSEGTEAGADEPPEAEEAEAGEESEEAAALEAARKGTLFANVLGTSLCEALSFTNHSCLPNVRMDFATSGCPEAAGPGLWVYCVARRPLIPGDEVLMAYVPSVVGKPLEVRQRRMKRFGFPCRCRTCLTDEMLARDGVTV